jgi:hypothetical protein
MRTTVLLDQFDLEIEIEEPDPFLLVRLDLVERDAGVVALGRVGEGALQTRISAAVNPLI